MWCFREECFSEIEPHLIELRARMKKVNADPSFEAKLAFIDNCCTKRAMWEKVFPYTKVKLQARSVALDGPHGRGTLCYIPSKFFFFFLTSLRSPPLPKTIRFGSRSSLKFATRCFRLPRRTTMRSSNGSKLPGTTLPDPTLCGGPS